MTSIVEARNLTKSYRGTPAIKNISIEVREGEIHALVGENGAGKSTLTKIFAGVVEPTSGAMLVRGQETQFAKPSDALASGIAMVFQETSLVPSMTVAQNLFLGSEGVLNRLRGVNIQAQQFLQSLNFSVDPTALVSTLGAAKKQMVEIARAVRQNAKLIIFDEPTATLTPEEKRHFFALIRRLKAQGVTIIFISHALEEAMMLADRISIMRDGELIITDEASTFDREKIVRAMVGRSLSNELYGRGATNSRRPAGDRVLSLRDVSAGGIVRNNSLSVFSGQITGLFGLIGSGRTETAKVIAGIMKRDFTRGGQIEVNGKMVRYITPGPAVREGIIYVTEDRKLEGFFDTTTVAANLYAGLLAGGSRRTPFVNMLEMRRLAQDWRNKLAIRTINNDPRVVELSGGNQQKVVIGKGLVQKPKIVIFDEPTRGVDVGAISEIHALINQLADEGLAVIVISSYLPEIMNLADRVLVFRQGRMVEEFSNGQVTEEEIMYAAVH
jgi:simple sugar transport system ATP-binding protein